MPQDHVNQNLFELMWPRYKLFLFLRRPLLVVVQCASSDMFSQRLANVNALCWLDDKRIILRYISTVNQWLNYSFFLQSIIRIIYLIWLDLKIIPTTFCAIFFKISMSWSKKNSFGPYSKWQKMCKTARLTWVDSSGSAGSRGRKKNFTADMCCLGVVVQNISVLCYIESGKAGLIFSSEWDFLLICQVWQI